MRFTFGIIILLVSGAAISAFGQTNAASAHTISISVHATVVQRIEMTTIRNMNIGDVQPGQQMITISPIADDQAGKMIASGRPNTRIRISFPQSWKLTDGNAVQPSTALTFNYQVSGNTVDEQATAEILQPDNRNLRFGEEGQFFFWIGGNVDVSDAKPGNYRGEFTIEIEYL